MKSYLELFLTVVEIILLMFEMLIGLTFFVILIYLMHWTAKSLVTSYFTIFGY